MIAFRHMGFFGGVEGRDSDRSDGLLSDVETVGGLALFFDEYSKDIGPLPHLDLESTIVSVDAEGFGQFKDSGLEHFQLIISDRHINRPIIDFSLELRLVGFVIDKIFDDLFW